MKKEKLIGLKSRLHHIVINASAGINIVTTIEVIAVRYIWTNAPVIIVAKSREVAAARLLK